MDRGTLRYPSDSEADHQLLLDQPAINVLSSVPDHRTVCERLRDKLQLTPKWHCYKNLAFHSISSFLVFTSFMTFQSLDSSLNAAHGLGSISFTVLYGGFILSCILAPVIVRHTGCKDAMLLCFFTQLLFALSHLYPKFYTLVPASLLLGLMLGPFWTAQGVYIVSLSKLYEQVTGKDYKTIVSIFYGVFNFFIMSSQKFGNLMESLILSKHQTNTSLADPHGQHCGAAYCGNTNHTSPSPHLRPSTFYVDLLVATFIGLCLVGIIVKAGLVDSIKDFPKPEEEEEDEDHSVQLSTDSVHLGRDSPGTLSEMLDTFVIHGQKNMAFLVPIFFYSGLQQGFVYGDYTRAFVACELGIGHIGYVMLAYGYADAFASLLVGVLERYTGRAALFTAATAVQGGLAVYMASSAAHRWPSWLVYTVPALWGLGDAVWQTTTSSMVATEFSESRDAAFACFRLWQAAGLATAFSYSHVLCTSTKLYVLCAAMAVALAAYYCIVGLRRWRRRQREL